MIDYIDGQWALESVSVSISSPLSRMCAAMPISWKGCIQNLNSGHLHSRHCIDWIDIPIMAFIMHMCLHCGSLGCVRAVSQLLEHRDAEKLLAHLFCYYLPWRKGQSLRFWWSLKMSQYIRHLSRVPNSKFLLLFLHHLNMHRQVYTLCTSPSCVWPRIFPAASHPVHNLKSLSPLTVYGTKILWHSPCPLHPIRTFSLSCQ